MSNSPGKRPAQTVRGGVRTSIGAPMDHRADHAWHAWINRRQDERRDAELDFEFHLYEFKRMLSELRRLPALFKRMREGTLRTTHQHCSHSAPELIAENYLACCLGEKIAECEILAGLRACLDKHSVPPEQQDEIQTATCCWHIYQNHHRCDTSEGYILDESDRRFWSELYESLPMDGPAEDPTP